VHLFGIDLEVDSLAFQEQDKALAACATVALWSCFHKASELFQTFLPTPGEITRAASYLLNHRPIPSRGLDVNQMCTAIRYFGLEPEVIEPSGEKPLSSLIYAHLRFGNPVLLGVDVGARGMHAVTMVGYSLREHPHLENEVLLPSGGIPLVGRRIDEFYAHDDQVGPFSRLLVSSSGRTKALQKERKERNSESAIIFTGDKYEENERQLPMWPNVVIIPTYHKIRLGFMSVYALVTAISNMFELVGSLSVRGFQRSDFEWDVHIVSSNAMKRKIRQSSLLLPEGIFQALTKRHPRYSWRILLAFRGKRILELLADTTAMEKSEPIYDLTWFDARWKEALRLGIARNLKISAIAGRALGRQLLALFEKSFSS